MTLTEQLEAAINNTPPYIDKFEEELRKAQKVPETLQDLKNLMMYSIGELTIQVDTIVMSSLDRSLAEAPHFITGDFFYV